MMKRVQTIFGYAAVTAFCGFLAFVVLDFVFGNDYAGRVKYVCPADKITCAMLGAIFFCLIFAFVIVYKRYKLYKAFYDSMTRRIEKFKVL
ncbi:MAG: hypothetical protein ACYTEQ_15455 [Planctomycetota bacterium]|jgi:hypothetical protein